jgi:hypothetical protein
MMQILKHILLYPAGFNVLNPSCFLNEYSQYDLFKWNFYKNSIDEYRNILASDKNVSESELVDEYYSYLCDGALSILDILFIAINDCIVRKK